jgi:hypothetical protein
MEATASLTSHQICFTPYHGYLSESLFRNLKATCLATLAILTAGLWALGDGKASLSGAQCTPSQDGGSADCMPQEFQN